MPQIWIQRIQEPELMISLLPITTNDSEAYWPNDAAGIWLMSYPVLYALPVLSLSKDALCCLKSAIFLLLYASPGRTAARTTYHHYFLKDSNKLQVAHNPHSLSIKLRFGYAYHMYTFWKVHILASYLQSHTAMIYSNIFWALLPLDLYWSIMV